MLSENKCSVFMRLEGAFRSKNEKTNGLFAEMRQQKSYGPGTVDRESWFVMFLGKSAIKNRRRDANAADHSAAVNAWMNAYGMSMRQSGEISRKVGGFFLGSVFNELRGARRGRGLTAAS